MSLDSSSVQRAILFAVLLFIVQLVARFVWNCYRRAHALRDLPGPSYGWFGICVLITDPELAREVLHSPHLDKVRYMYSFLDPFMGGLSLLTGPTDAHWKAVRKGVAPAFSAGNMRNAFKHIVERCSVLTDILAKVGPECVMNMDNLLLRESMDVIGRVGFEKEMGALEDFLEGDVGSGASVDVMLRCTHEVERRARQGPQRMMKIWRKDVRQGFRVIEQWQCVVRSLLKHMHLGAPGKGTFAHMLLRVKDPATGQPLSNARMLPEIAALFFAGIDTTGHSGAWTLYLLSQHPEVEARVVAELDALELLVTPRRPRPRALEWADLGRFTYLQAVIKEVLRMYPPVGLGQIRVNPKRDLTLAGGRVTLPAGTAVWVPHHAIQNTTHNWDQPEAFLPERWLEPGTEYATRRPMPAEWYRGWAPDMPAATPAADADVAQITIRTDAAGAAAPTSGVPLPEGASGAPPAAVQAKHAAALAGLGGAGEEAGLEGRRRAKRYFPFAEGQRHCVGMNLANVTLPVTLALLLGKFSFKLAPEMGGAAGVLASERYSLITGMANGMGMLAVPRSSTVADA